MKIIIMTIIKMASRIPWWPSGALTAKGKGSIPSWGTSIL